MRTATLVLLVRAAAETVGIDPERVLAGAAPFADPPRVAVYVQGPLPWTTARKLAKLVQAELEILAEVSFENASWRGEKGYVRCRVTGEPFNFPHFGGPGERSAA